MKRSVSPRAEEAPSKRQDPGVQSPGLAAAEQGMKHSVSPQRAEEAHSKDPGVQSPVFWTEVMRLCDAMEDAPPSLAPTLEQRLGGPGAAQGASDPVVRTTHLPASPAAGGGARARAPLVPPPAGAAALQRCVADQRFRRQLEAREAETLLRPRFGRWLKIAGRRLYRSLDGRQLLGGAAAEQQAIADRVQSTTPLLDAFGVAVSAAVASLPPDQSEEASLRLERFIPCQDVVQAYRSVGVQRMYPWQRDCLDADSRRALKGGNLVYSASTSAGKTLVAEILMLRAVLLAGKKAIMVLPFVALVCEKAAFMQRLFASAGVVVRAFHGGHGGAELNQGVDIAVCTFERANSLLNKLLENWSSSRAGALGELQRGGKAAVGLDSVGIVVFDEVRMR